MTKEEIIKPENLVYKKPTLMNDNPMHYCPGCSHGVVHKLIAEVIEEMGMEDKTIGVSPVGCAVFAYNYLDIDWQEAAHGRAPAVATAIKRLWPGRLVFTYQGDGDLACIGTAETKLMHIEVFKNVEDLHDVNAPGRRRRHGEDLVPAVGAANRLALHRPVVRQIRFGDEPAVLLHLLCNLVGNRPFVESVRTVLRNQLQAFGEVLLHQLIALLQRFTVFPEDGLAVFVIRNDFAAIGLEIVRQRIVYHKAVARQLDGRLHHLVQRHRAVFFQRQREARNGARRAGGQVRGQGFFTVRVALVIEEHVP